MTTHRIPRKEEIEQIRREIAHLTKVCNDLKGNSNPSVKMIYEYTQGRLDAMNAVYDMMTTGTRTLFATRMTS